MGSTPMARRAGRYPAPSATSSSSVVNPPRMVKSKLTTPKIKLAIARLMATAQGIAINSPMPVSFNAYPRISFIKSRGFAPSASRIPISWVRCATLSESTP
jgi:hypothetical protein